MASSTSTEITSTARGARMGRADGEARGYGSLTWEQANHAAYSTAAHPALGLSPEGQAAYVEAYTRAVCGCRLTGQR